MLLGIGLWGSRDLPGWGRWVPLLTAATGAVAYGFHALAPQVWDPSEVVWFVTLGVGWLAFGLAAVASTARDCEGGVGGRRPMRQPVLAGLGPLNPSRNREVGASRVTRRRRLGRPGVMTLQEGNLGPALEVGRRVGIAGVAALIGGILVLGAGGRLAMRLSGAMAIVNDPHTRFMLTGDGFRIGQISLDGTIGLIVFGGVFGAMIAAAYWALLKDRMPDRGRVWLGALAATAIGGNALVHPDNIDFVILEPIAMNVVLYPALAGLAGAAIVGIDGALTRRDFGAGPVGSIVLVSFAAVGASLVGMLTVVSVRDEPVMALELIVLAAVAVPVWIGQASRWASPTWFVRLGPVVAVAVVAIEWARLIASAIEILVPA